MLLLLCCGWLCGAPPAEPADRLIGHQIERTPSGVVIHDIAGEGAPLVGVVQRAGDQLQLVTDAGTRFRLTGPLARPRIAGPGYRVWVLGETSFAGQLPELRARRLGVLAPPRR